MRLRRLLDNEFARGHLDAIQGKRRDPFATASLARRWAYDAGYDAGRAKVLSVASELSKKAGPWVEREDVIEAAEAEIRRSRA